MIYFPTWRDFVSRFGIFLIPDLENITLGDNKQSSQPKATIAKTYHNHQDKHYIIVYVSNAGENCIFATNDLNIDT